MSETPPETISPAGAWAIASLQGRRVLVVEDEYILAEDLRAELEQHGVEVMGPVASVTDALDLLKQEPAPDVAILDINLQGEMVYPVADALRERSIPFIFATGYDLWSIPESYKNVPRAEKPVDLKALSGLQGR